MINKQLERDLIRCYTDLYSAIGVGINKEHIKDTPQRIVNVILEMNSGCFINPETVLEPIFEERNYDEMLFVKGIPFVSNCAHHGLPFFGKMHFAYLPAGKLVGLSKIPRFINVCARKPQIQEQLTVEIVDIFYDTVEPHGCGVVIEAYHSCMMLRGIESKGHLETQALRGSFKDNPLTRQEFFWGVGRATENIWP